MNIDENDAPVTQSEQNEAPVTPPRSKEFRQLENPREARAQSAADKLRARFARQAAADDGDEDDAPAPKAPAAKPAAAPEPSAKAEKLIDAIEGTGNDAPAQRKGETDGQYELRLAKALREARELSTDLRKEREASAVTTKELAKLKDLFERGKMNPLEFLDHLGMSFEDLVEGIRSDKYVAPKAKAKLPPELAEKLERLERAEAERERERAAAAERALLETDTKTVTDYIAEHADEFPLAAALKGAAAQIVRAAYADKTADFRPYLQKLEDSLGGDATALFGSEKALMAALKKDPSLKERVLKAWGISTEAPAAKPAAETATSLSGASTEAPAKPGRPLTRAERAAQVAAKLKARRAAAVDDDD